MGWIYAANVVTSCGKRGAKVGKAAEHRRDARLADHARDPQWYSFDLIKYWPVADEDACETDLLAMLRSRNRPIHGRETFCHSTNPVRATREFMGETVSDTAFDHYAWLLDKLWYKQPRLGGRSKDEKFVRQIALAVFLVVYASLWVIALGVGLVEIAADVAAKAYAAWKRHCEKRNQANLEKVLNSYSEKESPRVLNPTAQPPRSPISDALP